MNQLSKSKQRGISLLTVLLLLLIMTLLGLASLRSVIMQEKMASNLLDRSIGFQVAESALREAEALVITRPTYDGTGGLYPLPVLNAEPRWLAAGTVWRNAANPGGLSAGAPQFIIEEMGPGPLNRNCQKILSSTFPICDAERYRITARSRSGNRAQVTTQSIFALPSP